MATISSAGIGSGLDVNSIISQLMAIERQPLTQLQSAEQRLTTQVSQVGQLQSLVSAMRDKAGSLSSLTLWNQTAARSSDASAVTVTSASSAPAGQYAVQVQQLAAQQTVSSRVFTASDTPAQFAAGTLTIELGAWTGTPISGFTPKAGASAVTVTLTDDDDTLAEVRDKINAAGAGVVATIVNDATGSRLALRSRETGETNGFRVIAAETADDGVAANGLSALAYDALGASQLTLNQRAADAQATINGIAVVSASNTLTNVSDGVSLKLLRTTTSPVEIDVAADSAAVKTAIEDFIKGFNELATFIREQTKYNEGTRTGGALQGDSLAVGLQRQLRAVLNEASTASSTFTRLADIGITMGADGTLSIKSSTLDNALSNMTELRKLLYTDGTGSADSGFMRRFKELGDVLLGAEGAFETRNDSLQTRIDRINDRQAQMEARLVTTERRLRAQYEALDRNMGRLNGLSSYVGQQLQALNNFYTARNGG
jgi:flagellar hook-associated protein 2